MTTTYKSLTEELKENHLVPYTVINDYNNAKLRLKDLIQEEFANIARNIKAVKTLVNVSTDQEVSSGPGKVDLSKIPVHSSSGLFVSNGSIHQLPILTNTVTAKSVRVTGNGDTYITVDESGEFLDKPKTYFSSDIVNGMEFQYQYDGFILISLDVSFEANTLISMIALELDNSYSSQQTSIESIYLNNGTGVRFSTLRHDNLMYIIFEEEVTVSSLTFRVSSYAYIPQRNVSLLKIKKLSFGRIGYQENSSIVLGPIGSASKKIIKMGIGTDIRSTGIEYSVSNDLETWYKFNVENERGFSIPFDTIFSNSHNTITYKAYVRIDVTNTKDVSTITDIVFEQFSGNDCYDTTLEFGGSSITNIFIPDFTESIYDTKTEKYVYPDDVENIKNYRVTSIPYNPVIGDKSFTEKYGIDVVIDPNESIAYMNGNIVPYTDSEISNANFVYKLKDDYQPGKYTYVVNDQVVKSFYVYGTYLFSMSRYILRVNKTDTVKVILQNKNIVRHYSIEDIASHDIDDTTMYVSMAPIFVDEGISYDPAYFYPYFYDEYQSVTENGTNVQNGYWVIPYTATTYIKNKTDNMSIRDIDHYRDFIRYYEDTVERTLLYEARHNKISNVEISGTKMLTRVQFIDGKSEFIERKVATHQRIVAGNNISLAGVKKENTIDVYSSGYAKKFIRVYSIKDLISPYSYFVDTNVIYFNTKMDGETLNLLVETSASGRVLGDNYSVDYENGIVYFSSYQNNITISYEYLDMHITGQFYAKENISSDGILVEVGIIENEREIETFTVNQLPAISIGVIYD